MVELLRDIQGVKLKHEKWLAKNIIKAAGDGELCLVQALRSCGADINCEDSQLTPLEGAIRNGHTKVAEYLILQGARDNKNAALKMAVKNKQHSTISALLKVEPLEEEDMKEKLLRIATRNKDSTTLMLLKLEKGTEKLPTPDSLCPEVDKLFYATVVNFFEDQSPEFEELTVEKLLKSPDNFFDLKDKSNFRWLHLPANNVCNISLLTHKYQIKLRVLLTALQQMKWAEVNYSYDGTRSEMSTNS